MSNSEGENQGRRALIHAARRIRARPQESLDEEGLLEVVKGIADTGFLVAFANRTDAHHAWAVGLAERVTEPLLTCEPVLAETAFHLRSVPLALAMVTERLVRLDFAVDTHLGHLAVLAARYADRHPDLADLCLIRMSELHPRHSVITTDKSDFRIFRRNKREAIPVICPP